MLNCDRDELAIRYLVFLDELAKDETSQIQPELAAIRRLRLEARRLTALKDLLSHCRAHYCATPEIEDLVRGVSGCDRDELIVRYLLSLDELDNSTREASRAFTMTQAECVATKRRRVEAHKLSAFDALLSHCKEHGCLTPELAELTGVQYRLNAKQAPQYLGSTVMQGINRAPDADAAVRIG